MKTQPPDTFLALGARIAPIGAFDLPAFARPRRPPRPTASAATEEAQSNQLPRDAPTPLRSALQVKAASRNARPAAKHARGSSAGREKRALVIDTDGASCAHDRYTGPSKGGSTSDRFVTKHPNGRTVPPRSPLRSRSPAWIACGRSDTARGK